MSNPIEIMNNIPHEINMIAIKGAFHRVPLISGQLHIHSFIPQDIIYHTSNMLLQTQFIIVQFSSVQLLSWVRLFATTWTAARQASLSITNSRSLLKLMSIVLVMPSKYLILCCPLLLPPSIFPRISVFSNESILRIGWPKYWNLSFSHGPSNEYSGLISFRISSLRRLKKWKWVKRSEE